MSQISASSGLTLATAKRKLNGYNAIINGLMDINQRYGQNGSLATVPDGGIVLDRWVYRKAGTVVHTIQQVDTTLATPPTTTEAGYYIRNAMLLDVTTADASIAAGDACVLQQKIEGYNWIRLAQQPLVCSFWCKHTVAGTYCVSLISGGSDWSVVQEYTVAANTWTYVVVNFPASSSGTFDYVNGLGAVLSFAMSCGSNFQAGSTGTWFNGLFYATSNQVNNTHDAADNSYFTAIRLEVGYVPGNFWGYDILDELSRCQRYYYKTFPSPTAVAQNSGTTAGAVCMVTTQAGGTIFPSVMCYPSVQMRTTPTITTYNPQAANAKWRNLSTGPADSGVATAQTIGANGFVLYNATVAGDVAGSIICIHCTAEAEF